MLRGAHLLLLALFVATLLAFRAGVVPVRPAALAAICGALVLLYAIELGKAIRRRRVGTSFIFLGAIAIFAGGLANWLFSLQGYVILSEVDAVPLAATAHLSDFDAGPLSNVREMTAMLQLEKVVLEPAAGGFRPVSKIRLARADGHVRPLELAHDRAASDGTIRFHQGMFGFSPRIVIVKGDKTLFDNVVPFTTASCAPGVVAFNGAFDVAAQQLSFRGGIDLQDLDARMKGHPRLGFELTHAGKLLGRGELLPGHFADLPDGYRLGFAGMKRWSEIDISRRNYPEPMIAGALLIVTGVVVRRWR